MLYSIVSSYLLLQSDRQPKYHRQATAIAQPNGGAEAVQFGVQCDGRGHCDSNGGSDGNRNDAESIANAQQAEHNAKADGSGTEVSCVWVGSFF